MKYSELIDAVASASGLSKADTKKAVEATFESITAAVASGDGVNVPGFGAFAAKNRPAKTGRNPATGETIQIAAKTVAAFKPGKALADRLNA